MLDKLTDGCTIVVFSATVVLLYFITSVIRQSQYKLPPGPTPWPIIGNAWGIIGQKNLHQYFFNLSKKYGPIFKIKIGNVNHVVVNNADLALEIYVKKMGQFVDRPVQFSIQKLSEGGRDLITQNFNPFLKMHRKIVMQSIRGHITVGDVVETNTHEQLTQSFEYLRGMARNKEVFSPRYVVLKSVYKLYFKLVMDIDLDYNDPQLWHLCSRSKEVCHLMGTGFLADLAPSIFQWLPVYGNMKNAMDCRETLKNFFRINVKKMDKTLDENPRPEGACAHLLRARRETVKKDADFDLTDEDVVLTVVEMFLGGADSVANILEWIILELANNPEKQEKMYAEIQDILGDRPVSLKDRPNMIYSECVTFEGLRTGQTAPVNVRGSVLADTELGGYDIPQHTPILINHYALHVDEGFWGKDVDQFKPERFIDPDGKRAPKPKNFIPFAAGTRACVGEHLGKDNLFLLAVALVQKFKFSKPPGVKKLKSEYHGGFIVVNTMFDIVVEERK